MPSASGRLRNEFYCVDRAVAGPQLVPVLSLGCRLEMRSCAADVAASARHWYVLARREDAGGAPLPRMHVTPGMFGRGAMVEVKVPLAKMKMKQLSDELAAFGAPKSGPRKRVLQLRLRALIIRAAAAAHAAPAAAAPA